MSDVISAVKEVFYALFQGYCLQYFLGEFLESRLPKSKWGGLFVTVLYGVLKMVLNRLIPSGYESAVILKKQILLLFILFAMALCFYKAIHMITVFLVVTYMAVSEISVFFAYTVAEIGNGLFSIWNWCFAKGYITSIAGFEMIIKLTMYGLQIVFCVLSILLLYFSIKKVVRDYREKDYAIRRTEFLFVLTPGLVGFMICSLLRVIIITVENEIPKLMYDKYPLLLWIVPAILLLSLLSILYGVKLFQDIIYLNREKNSRIILEQQIGSMQEHMTEIGHVYSSIRSMKHDMKNTLSIIMQLAAENGKSAELQDYLSELNQTMDKLEIQFKTGNTVVDTLLNMKYHEVVRIIPNLQMDAEQLMFPDNLLIQSYDIGIILGNALDNAIEACRKLNDKEQDAETFIRLSSFRKGKMIFVEIENSFDGKVIRKRQSEFPVTDKADKEVHGIGFTNMKNAAEKYHGAVDWSVHDNVFILSVMLQNERKTESEF